MKKILLWAALLAAVWGLPRLAHPAVDIGKLEPVETVLLTGEGMMITLETDSGGIGSGVTLEEAIQDLKEKASGEIYLDTTNKILLRGNAEAWQREILAVFRPSSRICKAEGDVDIQEATKFLAIHRPDKTLNHLRSGQSIRQILIMREGRGQLVPE